MTLTHQTAIAAAILLVLSSCGSDSPNPQETQDVPTLPVDQITLNKIDILAECTRPKMVAKIAANYPLSNFFIGNDILYFDAFVDYRYRHLAEQPGALALYSEFHLLDQALTDSTRRNSSLAGFKNAVALDNKIYIPDPYQSNTSSLLQFFSESNTFQRHSPRDNTRLEPGKLLVFDDLLVFSATVQSGANYSKSSSDIWAFNPANAEFTSAGFEFPKSGMPKQLLKHNDHLLFYANVTDRFSYRFIDLSLTNGSAGVFYGYFSDSDAPQMISHKNDVFFFAVSRRPNDAILYSYDPSTQNLEIVGRPDHSTISKIGAVEKHGNSLFFKYSYADSTNSSRYLTNDILEYSIAENKLYKYGLNWIGSRETRMIINGDYIVLGADGAHGPDLYVIHIPSRHYQEFGLTTEIGEPVGEFAVYENDVYFSAPRNPAGDDYIHDLWKMDFDCS